MDPTILLRPRVAPGAPGTVRAQLIHELGEGQTAFVIPYSMRCSLLTRVEEVEYALTRVCTYVETLRIPVFIQESSPDRPRVCVTTVWQAATKLVFYKHALVEQREWLEMNVANMRMEIVLPYNKPICAGTLIHIRNLIFPENERRTPDPSIDPGPPRPLRGLKRPVQSSARERVATIHVRGPQRQLMPGPAPGRHPPPPSAAPR